MNNYAPLQHPILTKIAIQKHFGNQIKHYTFDHANAVVLVLADDSMQLMSHVTQESDSDFISKYLQDSDYLWEKIRIVRNQKLKNCDWSMMPDAKVNKVEWKQYRELLRNLPQHYSDPAQVQFPEPPQ